MNNILLHLWNQYKIYMYILIGICLALLASIALSSVPMQLEQARSADNFVDSIGVAVHLNYRNTAYEKYDEIVKPRLQELGVRHIRDGVGLEDRSTQQKFLDLAKIGIKSTLVMNPRKHTGSRAVKLVKSLFESVEAVEGPNEPGGKPGFPEATRQFQAELYSAMKADPGTAHLPVLSPSFFHLDSAVKLGEVACDIGNTHHYPRGKWGMPLEDLNDQLTISRITCSNKPIMITEAGYNTNTSFKAREIGVSEQAAAKYLLRLFLEYFNRDIKRFFTYQLIDSKPGSQGYGLLNYDGSPKPDFIALKNLIVLLQDQETIASKPLALEYNLKGDETNIHHTLLQKSNGNFYLILWQEVPSFEHKTKTDLVVPERPLTLTLNTPIDQATTYQPVNSINPLEEYKNVQQLKLKVPDHPLVIELVPS